MADGSGPRDGESGVELLNYVVAIIAVALDSWSLINNIAENVILLPYSDGEYCDGARIGRSPQVKPAADDAQGPDGGLRVPQGKKEREDVTSVSRQRWRGNQKWN